MTESEKLIAYARGELRGSFVLDSYRPKTDLIGQVAARLPVAHVVVVSAAWCKDCRSEVPKLVRIAEHLPGWTFELRGDEDETRETLGVRAIPTFIVYAAPGSPELGRIIEHPESGSIEGDLLAIAERRAAVGSM